MKQIMTVVSIVFLATLILGAAGCSTSQSASGSKAVSKDQPQLCLGCGEIKGTAACCNAEGRTVCSKCNLYKGSPGCCKIAAGTTQPVYLCTKCGEIKGTAACCKSEGRLVCSKCSLFKGSPGCCRIK